MENSELIEGGYQTGFILGHFISHVESFRVLLKEWEDGNFQHAQPAVQWDAERWGDEFLAHVQNTYINLRKEQDRLMLGTLPNLAVWVMLLADKAGSFLNVLYGFGKYSRLQDKSARSGEQKASLAQHGSKLVRVSECK